MKKGETGARGRKIQGSGAGGYRAVLEKAFRDRVARNPRYSMRAFARDLEISSSKLSEILHRKKGISRTTATRIADKLKLSKSEQELFLAQVDAEHGRSSLARRNARAQLDRLSADFDFRELGLDQLRSIADWHHLAILELTEVCGFRSDPEWIATRLGISPSEASDALERLTSQGLIERAPDGRIRQTQIDLATSSQAPSSDVRRYHSQILSLAEDKLQKTSMEAHEYSADTVAIDSSRIEEAKAALKEFRRRFCLDLQSASDRDRVYCLAMQFFPLDQVSEDPPQEGNG